MLSGRLWRSVLAAGVTFAAFPLAIGSSAPELRAAPGGSRIAAIASENAQTGVSTSEAAAELPVLDVSTSSTPEVTSTTQAVSPTTAVPDAAPTDFGTERTVSESDPSANQAVLVPAAVPGRGVAETLTAIGRILIPAAGVDETLREGIAQNVIDAGPAHWPGTAAPGGLGNVVIAGHRSTYSRPFHDLANLKQADTIVFETASGWRHTYSVERQFVVGSDAMWIVDQTEGRHVTLFTCHPIGSNRQRLITIGVLVKSESLT